MPRPDVALVTPYPTLGRRHAGRSGVASYGCNLARSLSNAGADVVVVAPREADGRELEDDQGVTVLRSFDRGPRALLDAGRAVRDTGARLVHLQHETFLYGGPSSIAALPLALRRMRTDGGGRRIAPVVTAHQVVARDSIDRGFTQMHRVRVPARVARAGLGGVQATISRLAGAAIVHEPAFAPHLRDAVIVPHGIERVQSPPRDAARSRLGLSRRLVVLCFGYLAPYKGLEAALEAARRSNDTIELVVAGGEHPRLAGRDRYAAELEARFGDVARFTGYVAEADVPFWFAAADVALLPYPRPFSSSGALALALAHGTPLLLSEQLARAVESPRALATATDPATLAARLQTLRDPAALALLRTESAGLARGRSW
ncbi:MAG: glycosyltransferase, partial [Burkholderiales bacterium]